MANKLKVQEQEAIRNLTALGWGIRRIARELKISRNTVRNHVRGLGPPDPVPIVEEILRSSPHWTAGSGVQTDPLSTAGKTGRNSLCFGHAELIVIKVEAGLSAQRIYQDLKLESSFNGSYQSVKRYVHKLRKSDPKLVHRIEVQPGEGVQVDFGAGPTLLGPNAKRQYRRVVLLGTPS